MNCDCIKKVNEKLKALGTELVVSFVMPEFKPTVLIATRKIGTIKGKGAEIIVTYCPFCGKKRKKK